uniref:Protein kinase domain-containing protein n=1 Tax=Macrostomum lignano TaxID=282301 RepID=A0A1I8IRG9_9PLAT
SPWCLSCRRLVAASRRRQSGPDSNPVPPSSLPSCSACLPATPPTRLAIAGLIADCRCSVERLKRPLRAFLSMALMLSALHAVCGLLMLPPCLSAGRPPPCLLCCCLRPPLAPWPRPAEGVESAGSEEGPAEEEGAHCAYLSLHLALTLPSAVVAALVFVAFVYTRCSQLAAGDAALLGNQSAASDSTGNWSASVPIESAISYYQYYSLSMENVTAFNSGDNEQLLAAFQGVLFCFIVLACPWQSACPSQHWTCRCGRLGAACPKLGLHVWLPLILWLLALGPVNEIVKHRQMRIKSKEDRAARLHFDTKLGMYSPLVSDPLTRLTNASAIVLCNSRQLEGCECGSSAKFVPLLLLLTLLTDTGSSDIVPLSQSSAHTASGSVQSHQPDIQRGPVSHKQQVGCPRTALQVPGGGPSQHGRVSLPLQCSVEHQILPSVELLNYQVSGGRSGVAHEEHELRGAALQAPLSAPQTAQLIPACQIRLRRGDRNQQVRGGLKTFAPGLQPERRVQPPLALRRQLVDRRGAPTRQEDIVRERGGWSDKIERSARDKKILSESEVGGAIKPSAQPIRDRKILSGTRGNVSNNLTLNEAALNVGCRIGQRISVVSTFKSSTSISDAPLDGARAFVAANQISGVLRCPPISVGCIDVPSQGSGAQGAGHLSDQSARAAHSCCRHLTREHSGSGAGSSSKVPADLFSDFVCFVANRRSSTFSRVMMPRTCPVSVLNTTAMWPAGVRSSFLVGVDQQHLSQQVASDIVAIVAVKNRHPGVRIGDDFQSHRVGVFGWYAGQLQGAFDDRHFVEGQDAALCGCNAVLDDVSRRGGDGRLRRHRLLRVLATLD